FPLFSTPLTLAVAIVSGLALTAVLLFLLRLLFGNSEAATTQDVSDRTGMIGKVILKIEEHGIGEVIYVSPGGLRKSIPARSVDGRRLERGEEVVVLNYQRGVAEVDTLDHFFSDEEHSSSA